jgi:MFS family permease
MTSRGESTTRPDDSTAAPTPDETAGEARTSWLQLGVVCASSFVVWMGFGGILPYLPLFLKGEADSSMLMIGVIASMYYVGTLLFASPLGWLSDAIGRKPVIVMGVALYAASTLLFTTTLEPRWFILFRLLEGIGAAAVGPAGQAFIADITAEHQRSKAYGLLTTAQFGGLIVGPSLAWPVYHAFGEGTDGFYAIFYAAAASAALATVALVTLIREPPATARRKSYIREHGRERPKYREVLTPAVLAFVLIAFTSHFSMGAFEVVWSIRLSDLGASLSYISLTFVAFSVPMLLSFAGGMLADRLSRFAMMFSGLAVAAGAWIVYGVTEDFTLILVASVVEGLAVAFSYPAKQAFLIQVSPVVWRGTVVGVENTSMQLAGLIGTLTAPIIYGWIGGYVLALAGATSLLGLAVAAPVLHRTWRLLSRSEPARQSDQPAFGRPQAHRRTSP